MVPRTYWKNFTPQQRQQPLRMFSAFRHASLPTLKANMRPQSAIPMEQNEEKFVDATSMQPKHSTLLKTLSEFRGPVVFARNANDIVDSKVRKASQFGSDAPLLSRADALKKTKRPPVLPLELATRRALLTDPNVLLEDLADAVAKPGERLLVTIAMANGDAITIYVTYQKAMNKFVFVTEGGGDEIIYLREGRAILTDLPVRLGRDDQLIFKNLTVLTIPEPTLLRNLADFRNGVLAY